jgi:intracellular sulfur oxidation DsrE/DsrF family protein
VSEIRPAAAARREFLAQIATTAAVAAAAVAGTACAAPLAAGTALTGTASSGTSSPQRATPAFDDSWTARVSAARHRAVFDSPAVEEGLALEQVVTYLSGYHEMFDATDADTVAVVVMRHAGTVMALGDALWDRYELFKRTKLKDPTTGTDARRNPFLRVGPDDKFAAISPGASLAALRARGVVLLACNRALMHFAAEQAKERGQDPERTKAEFREGLAPGVVLQPSGIYATTRAQEVGCAFLKAT